MDSNKMSKKFSAHISEAAYMDQIRNCVKFNKKFNLERKRHQSFFDQQTGIAQRPNEFLIKSAEDRHKPIKPNELVRYPAAKWRKKNNLNFDEVEFKFICSMDPALKQAVDSLLNPDHSVASISNEVSNDTFSQNQKYNGGRTNFEHLEYEDMQEDDFDLEASDEDDWGDKKKKRRRGRGEGFKGTPGRKPNSANMSSSSINTPGISINPNDARPFACTECGARYKSRPGLTYHRTHVHANADSPKSPKVVQPSPSLQISDTCDFCEGTKNENKRTKKPEELVSCHDCGRSAHPTCLNFTSNMIVSSKKHGWQCIECKSCAICGSSDHDDKLLFCDDCDRGFHIFCLNPPLKKPPDNEWSCALCQVEFGERASMPKR